MFEELEVAVAPEYKDMEDEYKDIEVISEISDHPYIPRHPLLPSWEMVHLRA
jgi:hypothetical protein